MSDPLSISLVPGYLLQDDEPITPAIARSIARPTIALTGSIGATTIDDGAVTTAKLADGVLSADATGRAKMADNYIIEAKINDGAVTARKLEETTRQDCHQYAAGVFTTGTYAITLAPVATAYTAGMTVKFKADTLNTGATDINVNGLGAKNLFKNVSSELAAGDIPANAVVTAIYDGTNFQMLAMAGAGKFVSSEISIATAGLGSRNVAHSMGSVPFNVRWVLVCQTGGDAGFLAGDEVAVEAFYDDTNEPVFAGGANATNVFCSRENDTDFQVTHKTNGNGTAITESKWKAKCYASL